MKFLKNSVKLNKEDLFKLAGQFMKFGIVGAVNTLLSLAIYYIFIYFSKDLYIIGQAVAFMVTVFNAYFWNNKYVFKRESQDGHVQSVIKTYLGYGFTLVLSLVLMYLMVDKFSVSEEIAPVAVLLVTIPLNFIINKFWALK